MQLLSGGVISELRMALRAILRYPFHCIVESLMQYGIGGGSVFHLCPLNLQEPSRIQALSKRFLEFGLAYSMDSLRLRTMEFHEVFFEEQCVRSPTLAPPLFLVYLESIEYFINSDHRFDDWG